jgi:hypothetical protein
MKLQLILLGILALTTMTAYGGPVSVDSSKSTKEVVPMSSEAWGGPVLGGGVKGNDSFIEGSLFLFDPFCDTVGTGSTMEGSLWFIEPYATWGEEGEAGASLALGYRHLFSDQSVADARSNVMAGLLTEGLYVGANVFGDYGHSQADNNFWQIGAGIEVGTRYLTLRSNVYIPLTDDKTISRRTETTVTHGKKTSTHLVNHGVSVVNGQVVQNFTKVQTTNFKTTTTTHTFELFEEALEGWDIELALLIPGLDKYCDVSLIGGYYDLEAERSHRDFRGWRFGVEARPVPAVVLFGTWFEHDNNLYHDDWIAGIRLEIPLDKNWKDAFTPRRRHLADRLYEPVHRKNSAITTSGAVEDQVNTTTTTNSSQVIQQSNTQIIFGPVFTPPPFIGD